MYGAIFLDFFLEIPLAMTLIILYLIKLSWHGWFSKVSNSQIPSCPSLDRKQKLEKECLPHRSSYLLARIRII